jgi:GDP-L-fucose synthase
MHCVKLLGQRLMARDFDHQVAAFQVRVAVLDGLSPRHTRHNGREMTLSSERGSPAISRFVQQSLAAAKSGGIQADILRPAEFLRDNLVIKTSVIHTAWQVGVEKLVFIGSSYIYPKFAAPPIVEEALPTRPLEATNEWYAIAKIDGLKLCQSCRRQYGADFISAHPTNLYGPGDTFDLDNSHVLPALLPKFHEAKTRGDKSVTLWGSGTPLREFLHVDDLPDALVFLLREYSGERAINVGSGFEVTIRRLAETIADVVGYEANLVFDNSKPNVTRRKLVDSSKLHAMGWNRASALRSGIADTYDLALKAGVFSLLRREVANHRDTTRALKEVEI